MIKSVIKISTVALLAGTLAYSYNSLAAASTSPSTAKKTKAKKPPRKYPHGCREIGYEFESDLLVLKPVSDSQEIQTVYMIHNKSPQPIRFMAERDPKDVTASDYENIVQGNQWSAFALNQPTVSFKCTVGDETQQQVNCGEVLELCQFNRAKFGTSLYGTYWMVQSASTQSITYWQVIKMGVLLRW